MHRLLPLVLLLAPTAGAQTLTYRQIVAQYPRAKPVEVLHDSARVFQQPDTTSDVVMRLPRRMVVAYRTEGSFVAVATVRDGSIGFMKYSDLRAEGEPPSASGVTETSPGVFVIEHDLSQREAYRRLRLWAAQTYVSAQDVIQMDDPETGTLVLKGAYRTGAFVADGRHTFYTLTLDVRDRRIRFAASTLASGGNAEGRQMQREFVRIRGAVIALLRQPATDDF